MNDVNDARWMRAQASESEYWQSITATELFRICYEKFDLIDALGDHLCSSLFDDRDVLEIGVGPVGLSVASYYSKKEKIRSLTKAEPLAKVDLLAGRNRNSLAFDTFKWANGLSEEGHYIQASGESLDYIENFDTIICYNVLDHVKSPAQILSSIFKALRKDGTLALGVDCYSLVGKLRFDFVTRNRIPDSILVQAHPYTFLFSSVLERLNQTGFKNISVMREPGLSRKLVGAHFRPVFLAKK